MKNLSENDEPSEPANERLEDFKATLEKLEKLGLIKEEDGDWRLTEKGKLYV
jgi:hypothetical protein